MNNYFELQIKINPQISDIVSEFCFEIFDCEGVLFAEEVYVEEKLTSTTEGTLKVFLRSVDCDLKKILASQRELLKSRGITEEELGSWEFFVETKENEDWSIKWKENWDVTHVSQGIVVVPDWLDYQPKVDEVIIKLEPGCAFGTGTHQTTQLCMIAIEKYMPKNAKVADIGMGSGILAICAKKFGASYVYGCDNDETVINVAKENAFKNNAECIFELSTTDKITEKFDFVVANILHNVLAEIMADLKNIMNHNSIMVLSGILDEKKSVVIDVIKKHELELVEEVHQDQWVALIVKKGE